MSHEILSEKLISLHLHAANKEESIVALSEMLFHERKIYSIQDFTEEVLKREADGDTTIGKGVALPHGISDAVIESSVAIGRLDAGIAWGSKDTEQVQLIVLLAVRDNAIQRARNIALSKFASVLSDENTLEKMMRAKDTREMISLFI
ncbi:PTS sugar transporter subunit IIA [Sporolactobacillus sp. STSJ-5]|uniref:PTS sugar transporter subunit IIA n=1 Tax=Sporolactobacillus sp. STSJ-5 TaxID=2965076 RepID=UPI002106EDBC|nr:PTS sugar transporter subunit IIA [Sporolactobacillus sp. STSJ-5]MCQ2009492.1 PTS sugar transporter subunit IIA [Sporolactobacillus sp. STSJ-5]